MGTQSHHPISLPSFSEPLQSIGSTSVRPLPLLGDPPSGTNSHSRKTSQVRRKRNGNGGAHGESYRHSTTIGMLPDGVLLEIFDFCQESLDLSYDIVGWEWHILVHVCRKWRQIVFDSPKRLNLRIICRNSTPVRKSLDIWPAFPIAIYYDLWDGIRRDDEDNVIAALEHPDRVWYLRLNKVTGSQLDKMSAVMQEPFPVLTHLNITAMHGYVPVLPTEFLGGSAPSLQKIILYGIPFPALPTLLLSTSDLVTLKLRWIPPTGNIPPEAMAVGLAALPRLREFNIEFQLATPRPDRIHPPPVTRSTLPALTSFRFQGASEYLEDLVARIDAPQLDWIQIIYSNQLIDFQVAQLTRFVDRSLGPKLTRARHPVVRFDRHEVNFGVDRNSNTGGWNWGPGWTSIFCEGIDWQVSHMAQVLTHLSATVPNAVHLKLEDYLRDDQLEGADDAEWVLLLQQITTVRTLHVSRKLAGHVALALENIAEIVAEVLPSLDLIYLEGQPASSIEKFVAVRQLSGRSVTVIATKAEFDERLESYDSE